MSILNAASCSKIAPSMVDVEIMKIPEEKALIQACLQGDEQAQTALYEQYKGKMYAVCLRYARTDAEAEDFLVNLGYLTSVPKVRVR